MRCNKHALLQTPATPFFVFFRLLLCYVCSSFFVCCCVMFVRHNAVAVRQKSEGLRAMFNAVVGKPDFVRGRRDEKGIFKIVFGYVCEVHIRRCKVESLFFSVERFDPVSLAGLHGKARRLSGCFLLVTYLKVKGEERETEGREPHGAQRRGSERISLHVPAGLRP